MKSIRFDDSVALSADEDLAWQRVSDLEKATTYWPLFTSLIVLKREGGLVYVKIGLAGGGSGNATVVGNEENRTVLFYHTSGPLEGTQRVTVARGKVQVSWDVRLDREGGVNESGLRIGTKEALERIAGVQDALA